MLGVDATRGIALLGMIAVHVLPVTTPAGTPSWSAIVAEGPAAATFAVLAGVGIAFMTGRRRVRFWAEGAGTAAMLATRALVIGVIGLLLGVVTDAVLGAVILPYYAALFVLAIPLVILPTRALLALGAVCMVALPALDHVLIGVLPTPTGANPDFAYLVGDPGRLLTELTFTGYYPAVVWTVYLCFGIALGRMRLASAGLAARFVGVGVAMAVVAKVVSEVLLTKYGGLAAITSSAAATHMPADKLNEAVVYGPDGVTPAGTWWWEALATAHSSTPFDLLYTVGLAMALLGAMLLLEHVTLPGLRGLLRVVRIPLAAAGSMTLTMYTAHILFINVAADDYTPTTSFVIQVVAVLVLGVFWWATAGKGPLEAFTGGLAHRARRLASRSADR